MKVAGFTIIRNAIKYDFPIKEAILSIAPLCDVIYVGVGNSEDNTRELINSISEKVIIIDTIWDDNLRKGGKVLAVETNKVYQLIPNEYDWCIYIQGDEAIHEKYHDEIKRQMLNYKNDKSVDGLLCHYLHFYGSYNYVAKSSQWYRHEIRVIKNNKEIYSYKDAQGFRKGNDVKLSVKLLNAYVYHYGYVKEPKIMNEKINNSNKMWHDDKWLEKNKSSKSEFDFYSIDYLEVFQETHPSVFQERLKERHWDFYYDTSKTKRNFKENIKYWMERITGKRIGEYKNYKLI